MAVTNLERFAMEQAGEVDYLITCTRAPVGMLKLPGITSSTMLSRDQDCRPATTKKVTA